MKTTARERRVALDEGHFVLVKLRLTKAQKAALKHKKRLLARLTIVQVDPQLKNHVQHRRLRIVIRR